MARQNESVIPGTTIKESSMEKMIRHNRELTGVGQPQEREPVVNHEKIAEGLDRSQPILLPTVGAPRVRATRFVERVLQKEGVQGTSPTPGQDEIDYIPPTTSNTADPGNPGQGPDASNQPASKTKAERMLADLSTLFAEGDNPFAKKGKGDDKGDDEGDADEGDDDGDDKDEKDSDSDDKDKDDKDKDDKDGDDGDGDEEPVEEAVQVNCESCGYEETYVLSEANIAEGNVPLTPEGKLNNQCPMCGADMDLSMVGATNQGEISDPNPRTDARGNSGPSESVAPEALKYAQGMMQRIVAGESVEDIARLVIEGDFIPRKRTAA